MSAARYDSFVVRVCHRSGVLLHGQVTHVGSRRTRLFTDVEAILDFIRASIGGPAESIDPEPPP